MCLIHKICPFMLSRYINFGTNQNTDYSNQHQTTCATSDKDCIIAIKVRLNQQSNQNRKIVCNKPNHNIKKKVKFTRFNNINHIYKSSMDIVESQNCMTSFSCVTTIIIFFISLNLENAFFILSIST